jgi:peptidoglycan/LPS O-acetylase OafA/YrhL
VLPVAHHFGHCKALNNALEPWFWLHLSNWRLAFGQQGHWLQHFWSLAIEEQFYLLWPLVVFISGRRWLPYVCIIVAATSFGLRCMYADHHFGFFLYALTPFRIEPLAVGCLAATLVRSRMLAFVKRGRWLLGTAACGFLMLCAAVWTARSVRYDTVSMSTYGFTALAIIYVCLVLYAYIYSGSFTWLASQLRQPLLRQLGKYSYAMYVFHMGLFMAASVVVERVSAVLPERWRFIFWLFALLGTISLTYAVALVFWQLVEKHFWSLKSRFRVQSNPRLAASSVPETRRVFISNPEPNIRQS